VAHAAPGHARSRAGAALGCAALCAALAVAACSERTAAASAGSADTAAAAPAARVGCRAADSARVATDSAAITEDVRAGRVYECASAGATPAFRAVLVGDPEANLITRVELFRAGQAAPWQVLAEGAGEPPYRGADVFAGRDLDADGDLDVMLLSGWGATGNQFYSVWRFDQDAGRFEYDSVLSALTSPAPVAGQPCVSGRSTGGAAGRIRTEVELCLTARGRWAERRLVEFRPLGAGDALLRVTRDSGAGGVRTRTDTVPDSTGVRQD
jgi:hypothetical protein